MRLDRPVVKVIDQVLDASEDWLASALGGGKTVSTDAALAAINALVGDPTDGSSVVATSQPVAAEPAVEPAPAPQVAERVGDEIAARVPHNETVRLNAQSLDRIVRSAGQLLTESQRQNQITQALRQVNRDVADIASERSRIRKKGARAFRRLEASPE